MRSFPGPAELAPSDIGVLRREALEIDAAVDHFGFAIGLRNLGDEAVAEPARNGDHACCPPHDMAGRGANAGDGADVGDVLTVGGHDERRASRERSGQAGGNEKMRIRDVRVEPPGDTPGVPEERDVAAASSPGVHDRALDLVSTYQELALEVRNEDSEVRIVRARVHLGNEQDAQGYPRVTWRIPRHISSVVPSPQRT